MRNSFARIHYAIVIRKRAHVPQFDGLIFTVRDEVSTVASWINVRYTVHVTRQHANRIWIGFVQRSPVPDLSQKVGRKGTKETEIKKLE